MSRSEEFGKGLSHASDAPAATGWTDPSDIRHHFEQHGGKIWYPQGESGKAEPRCDVCGHRTLDPRTGSPARETRTLGPLAIAKEIPMRALAKRQGK